jgi:tRNA-specific 2-thiouridylase
MSLKDKRIVVGMSGGIDSSMSLVLLRALGYEPIGLTLKLPTWQNNQSSESAIKSAKTICQKAGVPHFVLDVQKEFKKEVVDYFIKELETGRTPNPCVICNPRLKFKKLFEFASRKGIELVATGHYAKTRLNKKTGKYELLKAKDKKKDQSYYLSFLTHEYLKNIIFPLGNYTKEKVYEMAGERGFKNLLERKQSQDFCFLGNNRLSEFLEKELGKKPGKIVDEKGIILGEHQGVWFYTIGQRKGINLSGGPYFVKELDKKKNLVVATKNKKELFQKEIFLSPFNFISKETPKKEIKIMAKTRYRQKSSEAILFPPENKKLKIIFSKPQLAVTPGQFCIFYDKDACLGAGIIN